MQSVTGTGKRFTCKTDDASRKSIREDSMSVCTSREKEKLQPANTLSNSSLHQLATSVRCPRAPSAVTARMMQLSTRCVSRQVAHNLLNSVATRVRQAAHHMPMKQLLTDDDFPIIRNNGAKRRRTSAEGRCQPTEQSSDWPPHPWSHSRHPRSPEAPSPLVPAA